MLLNVTKSPDVVRVVVPEDLSNVTAPVYTWPAAPLVVTSAPIVEAPSAAKLVAFVIAAFKSNIPLIEIAPTAVLLPIVPPNCTVAPVALLVFIVKFCVPLIVAFDENVTASEEVVKVLAPPVNSIVLP